MSGARDALGKDERDLVMGADIIVNTALVGAGASLLGSAAPLHAFRDGNDPGLLLTQERRGGLRTRSSMGTRA